MIQRPDRTTGHDGPHQPTPPRSPTCSSTAFAGDQMWGPWAFPDPQGRRRQARRGLPDPGRRRLASSLGVGQRRGRRPGQRRQPVVPARSRRADRRPGGGADRGAERGRAGLGGPAGGRVRPDRGGPSARRALLPDPARVGSRSGRPRARGAPAARTPWRWSTRPASRPISKPRTTWWGCTSGTASRSSSRSRCPDGPTVNGMWRPALSQRSALRNAYSHGRSASGL